MAAAALLLVVASGVVAVQRLAPSPPAATVGGQTGALSGLTWASAAAEASARTASSVPATVAASVRRGLVVIDTALAYQGARAAGTGMVLTSDGLVLTNNHVVEGATSITVTDLANGTTYRATVLGYDRQDDVALLRLAGASRLPTVRLGDSANLQVGQKVLAAGNAGGTGTPTYATGTVTALGRTITASDSSAGTSEQLTGLVQTDARIVPGDSGGPLADAAGAVVGMDTAGSTGYRLSGGGQGFAIPIQRAVSIARQIAAGETSAQVHVGATAFLGVEVATGASPFAASGPGATIAAELPGGPGERAGLRAGDTITAIGGLQIASPAALTERMMAERPGTTVAVQYLDPYGGQHTVQVRLGSGPAQ